MRDYQTWGKQYMKLALTGFMEKRMSCGGARKLGLFFFSFWLYESEWSASSILYPIYQTKENALNASYLI